MEATRSSRCPVCDELIQEGDEIGLTSDQEWAHADCARDERRTSSH